MADQVIRLVFPPYLMNVPVINNLIRNYDLTVNIIRADLNPQSGWIDIQVTGNPSAIENAIAWLTSQGIDIQHLSQ